MAIVGLGVGCSGTKTDGGAVLGCQKFREMAGDVQQGIVAMSEVRDRLKSIHDDAQYSTTPAVVAASTRMLKAATDDDIDALGVAVKQMDEACTGSGK